MSQSEVGSQNLQQNSVIATAESPRRKLGASREPNPELLAEMMKKMKQNNSGGGGIKFQPK